MDIEIANDLWLEISRYVPDKQKAYVALKLIDIFEKYGYDGYSAVELANAANINFQFVDGD